MDKKESLPPSYFEEVYRAKDDPWDFETSQYEAAKYAATLAALPQESYRMAWEIGCSIGVLTEKLAAHCDDLLAIDVSERALQKARARCRQWPQVRFKTMRFPEEMPAERFDLILVSEVGYYLSVGDWQRARAIIAEKLNLGGHVILVHWTPTVHDYPQTGDAVHDSFLQETAAGWRHLSGRREDKYRLDVFEKPD